MDGVRKAARGGLGVAAGQGWRSKALRQRAAWQRGIPSKIWQASALTLNRSRLKLKYRASKAVSMGRWAVVVVMAVRASTRLYSSCRHLRLNCFAAPGHASFDACGRQQQAEAESWTRTFSNPLSRCTKPWSTLCPRHSFQTISYHQPGLSTRSSKR